MMTTWIRHYFLLLSTLFTGCLTSITAFAYPAVWDSPTHYESLVPLEQRAITPEPGKVTYQQYLDAIGFFGPLYDQNTLDALTAQNSAASPCNQSLQYLHTYGFGQPASLAMLQNTWSNLKDLPPAYGNTGSPVANPWDQPTFADFENYMMQTFFSWCEFLPDISGDQDNGLKFIQHFAWFYYQNDDGVDWVQGNNPAVTQGATFLQQFNSERGAFMNSSASTAKIQSWIDDPRIEIEDYQRTQASQYTSWNDFFTRNIKTVNNYPNTPPLNRPPTMMDWYVPSLDEVWSYDDFYRDYIIASPTDCIMNPLVQVLEKNSVVTRQYLDNPLQENTVLDVKGIPISLVDLLKDVDDFYLDKFVGGSGLACVLMPNTYHHFHTPVTGNVVHAEVVGQGTFGYPDWPNWVPTDGNVGRPGTDFSQFQKFQRGVIIIEVYYCDEQGYVKDGSFACKGQQLTGYVASVPVGLDTIGSVELDAYLDNASPSTPVTVFRTRHRLGHFNYGGSLNILLFSKGLSSPVIQTRLGSQVGIYDVGIPPQ